MNKANNQTRGMTRVLILALAIIALLGAGAYAAHQRSLRELVVQSEPGAETAEPAEASDQHWDPLSGGDFISLQGYADSPEHRAMEEWSRFLSEYDADGTELAKIGNAPTGLAPRYDAYFAYTQEMADRLDAIAAQYGLTLHENSDWYEQQALFDRVGGAFLTIGDWGGYAYPDGTFQCDEEGELPGFGNVMYQLRRTTKGVLDEVGLSVGDAAEYEQWSYAAASGETVLLALGQGKALIFADLPGSFAAVNVLAGTDSGLTAEHLEALADSIDFSLLG